MFGEYMQLTKRNNPEELVGKKVTKSFSKSGTYKIYAKVFDDQGEWRKKILFITIKPQCTIIQIMILLAGITFFLLGLGFQFKWYKKFGREKKIDE